MTDIAFFTRLLDAVSPAERLRLAREQIQHAERHGFARAWVAQHHFRADEGGLPSPFVLLASIAERTSSIRLGTGVVTLTLEDPVRVAEDAVVADLLSDGRVDLGLGSGGTPTSFAPFRLALENKSADYERKLEVLVDALAGRELGAGNTLYPPAGSLADRVWQATFSAAGGERAGRHGHGLLLSRTQPRQPGREQAALAEIQQPIIDAYLDALPSGVAPRITASRTVFVADDRAEALRFADAGLRRQAALFGVAEDAPLEEVIRRSDTHLGTADEVAESLAADAALAHADEVAIQVHSVDAPHAHVLRSLELFASEVAPRFGWGTDA
ncbi:putative FMN-dependent luciferase-like monooxygenase [Leucobacter triazinivorans]|uniref:Putative FMN-dependent luciferase-like monooxygenase n=1 Tax=Leucobacter triazinivorans TaxID=1784719 RepID=A0A4P6KHA3_9MICO|nr:putative FMN-dependent luciferase-like monooxygenase [Leucobacter triazinivorans]QBE49461.1 putative FMN-dependent luciferase-like monooxygenase [Leucobacter triazinivorans]